MQVSLVTVFSLNVILKYSSIIIFRPLFPDMFLDHKNQATLPGTKSLESPQTFTGIHRHQSCLTLDLTLVKLLEFPGRPTIKFLLIQLNLIINWLRTLHHPGYGFYISTVYLKETAYYMISKLS